MRPVLSSLVRHVKAPESGPHGDRTCVGSFSITNARLEGWWDEVTLLIWGPSVRLAARDPKIQECLARMKDAGVELVACKQCANNYGVAGTIEEQGVKVFYAGTYLTEKIKGGESLITF